MRSSLEDGLARSGKGQEGGDVRQVVQVPFLHMLLAGMDRWVGVVMDSESRYGG